MDIQATRAESERMSRFGREVRGTLLASAYEIEYILDQVLLGIFFPGQESSPTAERTLFDDRLLKHRPLTFAYKVNLLFESRKALPKVAELVPETLVKDLQVVLNYRNDFAHYPVVLYPDGDKPVTKLKAILVGSKSNIELNDETVKEIVGLFLDTTTALNTLIRSLNEGALKSITGTVLFT
jgi:hypothetical protein